MVLVAVVVAGWRRLSGSAGTGWVVVAVASSVGAGGDGGSGSGHGWELVAAVEW